MPFSMLPGALTEIPASVPSFRSGQTSGDRTGGVVHSVANGTKGTCT